MFALDTGPGGTSFEDFTDLAVSYTVAGAIAAQLTVPGAWQDRIVAVAGDAFGGVYATGVDHKAAAKTAILTVRGSVLTDGGLVGLWAPWFVY